MADRKVGPGGVYAIRNSVNGKRYVGSSVCLTRRMQVHRRALTAGKHHSEKLQRAWDKHGPDAFVFETVEIVGKPEHVLGREQFWIDHYKSASDFGGYNVCRTAGNILGVKRSPETLAKMSRSLRGKNVGRKAGEETRKKISAAHIGKPKSDKVKAAVSAAQRGRPKSPEHRAKLSASHTGKSHTAEARIKIGAAARGRVKSPQERANISASKKGKPNGHLGRKDSPETIAKRVAARRRTMAAKSRTQSKQLSLF